jgi:hypothetical protein
MIKVDFLEIERHLIGKPTLTRVQFDEIEDALIPSVNDTVYIGNRQYRVVQRTFFPFGDTNGIKGITVYLNKI